MDRDAVKGSNAAYSRMTVYLKALYLMKESGKAYVSSVALAGTVKQNASVVKKDLSFAITREGKPKIGYEINCLITDIEDYLDYSNVKDAVLVGAGKLGQALLGYVGFEKYGFNIICGFDVSKSEIGKTINGKSILPMEELPGVIDKMHTKIAILTTPKEYAQKTTDLLVESGIRAIWNFTPGYIHTPDTVAVKNEDMAASLAILSKKLNKLLKKENS